MKKRQLKLPKQVDFLGKKFTVDNTKKSELLLILHKLGKNKLGSKTLIKTVKRCVSQLKENFNFDILITLIKLFVLDNTLKELGISLVDLDKDALKVCARLDQLFSKEPPIYDHHGFIYGMESFFFLLMKATGLDKDEFKKRVKNNNALFNENLLILLSHLDVLETWFANQDVFWQTNLSIFDAKNLFRYRPKSKLRVEEIFPDNDELIKVLKDESCSLPATVDIKKLREDLLWVDYKNKKPDIEIYNEEYLLKDSLLFKTAKKAPVDKQLTTNLLLTLTEEGLSYETKMIANKTVIFVKFFGRIIAIVPDGVMVRMFITPDIEGAGFLGLSLNDWSGHADVLMLMSSLFINTVRVKPVNSVADFIKLKHTAFRQRDILKLTFYDVLRELLGSYVRNTDRNEICIKINNTFWRFVLTKTGNTGQIEVYKNRKFLMKVSNNITVLNIMRVMCCLLDYEDRVDRFAGLFSGGPELFLLGGNKWI